VEEHRWGSEAIDPQERSLPALKVRFLIDHLPDVGRVMEIGSGDGKILRTVHAAKPQLELHGCDIRTPRSESECYAFHPLDRPLPHDLTGTFDVVIIMDVLEHVPDPSATIADAARLLQRNGRLVAFVPVEGETLSAYTVFKRLLGDDIYVKTKDHIQSFSHDQVLTLITSTFDLRERRYAYHLVGQAMDAAFFGAQKVRLLRDMWRRDNCFYNADKGNVNGVAGIMNQLLRAGNAVAWAESRWLARTRFASAGVLLVAVPKAS